jgi:hypothetical protein
MLETANCSPFPLPTIFRMDAQDYGVPENHQVYGTPRAAPLTLSSTQRDTT